MTTETNESQGRKVTNRPTKRKAETMKIKYIAQAVKWFDQINGNTYHSVSITRCRDGTTIVAPFQYGYGNQYQYSALEAMAKAKWLPKKYRETDTNGALNVWLYERENNYPVYWTITQGTKQECKANGKL